MVRREVEQCRGTGGAGDEDRPGDKRGGEQMRGKTEERASIWRFMNTCDLDWTTN